MKNIVILIIVASLTGCLSSAPNRPAIAPKTEYNQIIATVYSPNEPGWFLGPSNIMGIIFGKQLSSPTDTAIANTIVFKVEGFEKDQDFLNYIADQREKNDDKSRFKAISINNEQVTFKNTACLKYRGLSEDHKSNGINSTNFQYFKTTGYICRHPFNNVIAFQMEVSHRSSSNKFHEGLLSTAEEFFSDIQFRNEWNK